MERALLTPRPAMQHVHEFLRVRRSLGSRVHTAMWTAVLIGVGWTGCALPADECKAGDYRCNGAVVETCRTSPGGIDGNFNDPSVSHHDASANWWREVVDCGATNLCKTSKPAASGGGASDAFCVLEPTPDPVCGAPSASGSMTSACAGTTAVDCYDGFAVARRICASCDQGRCQGGVNASCSQSKACAPGLVCAKNSTSCQMPCACPEGAVCDSCRPAEDDPPAEVTFSWVCRSGFCFQQY